MTMKNQNEEKIIAEIKNHLKTYGEVMLVEEKGRVVIADPADTEYTLMKSFSRWRVCVIDTADDPDQFARECLEDFIFSRVPNDND